MTTFSVPTRINIKKRIERIVYRTLTTQDRINLAYITSPPVTPKSNLTIIDKSTSLPANRFLKKSSTYFNNISFISSTDKPLVTNIFSDTSSSQVPVPLYYKHILSTENFHSGIDTLISIEFLNVDLKIITVSDFALDMEDGIVYNNLVNSFDGDVATVYYIKYTVKASGTNRVFYELLNNEQVFSIATIDDLDTFNNLSPSSHAYLVAPIPGGSFYTITLPVLGPYAYTEVLNSKIKILPPSAVDISTPWNVRINNGSFLSSPKATTSILNYKYYIAEYFSQLFYPQPPYRPRVEEVLSWVNNRLLYTGTSIALDSTLGLFLTIQVRDSLGVAKYAFTDDPSLLGDIWEDSIYYTSGIKSVDEFSGFIQVGENISDTDVVTGSYTSIENEFVFSNINFNPTDNQDILQQKVVFYIMPETAETGVLEQTLFYLVVDSLGKIVYSSQALLGVNPIVDANTTRMVSEDFYTDGTPRRTFYYDRPTSDFTDGNEYSFIDKYCSSSILFLLGQVPVGTVKLDYYTRNPLYLILGDVTVGESSSTQDLSIYDVRVQGGGIKPELYEETLLLQPEASWYSDHNIQKPYPGVGAFSIELPNHLLEENDGLFTWDQLFAIVTKHTTAGAYPLLTTYGIGPVITSSGINMNEVTLGWPSYGGDVTYNVYNKIGSTGNFIKINTNSLSDNISGNTYTVSGLNSPSANYIKIGATDSLDIEDYSQTLLVEVN